MSNLTDINTMQQTLEQAELLYNASTVEKAISQMAESITKVLINKNPLVFTVMNGGLVVAGKLLTQLPFPLESVYLHATRYRNTTHGGELNWLVKPQQPIENRTILIIDDILDEGHTLAAIIDYCRTQGAKDVYTAVLVNKNHNRKARPDLKVDFVGLNIEDRYIFGFGMDYCGYWRNANGIYACTNQ